MNYPGRFLGANLIVFGLVRAFQEAINKYVKEVNSKYVYDQFSIVVFILLRKNINIKK